MNPALKNLCEQIDATVFTGDALEVGETLREFKEYLGRWHRAHERLAYRSGYIDGRERRFGPARLEETLRPSAKNRPSRAARAWTLRCCSTRTAVAASSNDVDL
jgi:hypothetical protein